MMMNKWIGIGRLTRDVELRYTESNKAVGQTTIAINRPYQKEGKNEADFINIVIWDKQAEVVSKYAKKGSLIAIEGKLQTRSYEKDGGKRYITEIVASNVQFLETKPKDELKQNEKINNGLPEENLEMPF